MLAVKLRKPSPPHGIGGLRTPDVQAIFFRRHHQPKMRRLLVVSRVSRYPEEGERISQILTRMGETSAVSVRFLSGALSAKK